jgi:hypothetical protein
MKEAIENAIRKQHNRYETTAGQTFIALPVSQIPSALRDIGYKNVSRDFADAYELRKFGLQIGEARYISGARPKRFCLCVLVDRRD